MIEKNTKSAVFLPSVPIELGWSKIKTMEELSLKAGLDTNDWKSDNTRRYLFSGFEF